jgi:DNA invertase Pin-like site-specific DNA recombinase
MQPHPPQLIPDLDTTVTIHHAQHRGEPRAYHLTCREAEVLGLAAKGLSASEIALRLGISRRTVEGHVSAARTRIGARSLTELIARCYAVGMLVSGTWPPSWAGQTILQSETPARAVSAALGAAAIQPEPIDPRKPLRDGIYPPEFWDGFQDNDSASTLPGGNSVRVGYARISAHPVDDRAQLDAIAAAHCHKVIIETASARYDRPQLHRALAMLQVDDTLVIYRPDRVARSMKELMILLDEQLRARGANLDILSGVCAGLHCPNSANPAARMLFMVTDMVFEMERGLNREHTLDTLC